MVHISLVSDNHWWPLTIIIYLRSEKGEEEGEDDDEEEDKEEEEEKKEGLLVSWVIKDAYLYIPN
ncbi:hypothetical protein E2C01_044569 [Portunus trituberculatus]|uniref:Uncharacterized protein n=1 Tax=Portunus trituberculatus TaxID=210409 RepID=A0A5B7FZP9_PORTR|nr:hypothetical protein [Portunus trituberculatus]